MKSDKIQEVENTEVVTIRKVLYSGNVLVTGGRDGEAKSNDGRLDIELTPPGSKGNGTNPEQLLAAGWSACFIGAMHLSASNIGISLPSNLSVHTVIDLATNDDGFFLQAHLQVNLPDMILSEAKEVVEIAHQTCPYSKATRGNINVKIEIMI
ncbi:organic hydroperoxide resistance protein [Chryseobacterium sp.]|uniref:organic hydroperoxide resistance protein n=1 Tax=Chryseobacterium sp. TaxID=1871047 RepID=UPI0025B8EB16|nr:organic hydroperoxide resistance protein [Chryseobacterium sp.]MBV8327669.1 organic hydroperoxide resistance protein [Chryseobacterium sp.]